MPSAAMSGSMTGSSLPSASSASARCTVVSCSIRRAHQPDVRPGPQDQTGVSGPAARSAVSSGVAPAASHWARPSADSRGESTSGNGTRRAASVSTMVVAHRWMVPACWARSPTVQPGQLGTSTAISGASATTAASVEISFSARSQNQSWSSTTPGYRLPGVGLPEARGGLPVEPRHRLEDADRLVGALALDHPADDELQAALDLLDVDEGRGEPDLRPDGHRGGKADLVEPVVHRHLDVGHREDLRPHRNEQRQGEEPVRDRPAERRLGHRPLRVHVDPLVVIGCVGERVHPVLSHLEPFAGAEHLPLQRGEFGQRGRRAAHLVLRSDARVTHGQTVPGRLRRAYPPVTQHCGSVLSPRPKGAYPGRCVGPGHRGNTALVVAPGGGGISDCDEDLECTLRLGCWPDSGAGPHVPLDHMGTRFPAEGFLRHRGLILTAAGGAVVEGGLLALVAPNARSVAPQVTAVPSLAAYHDLRWLFTDTQSWLWFAGLVAVVLVARAALDVVMLRLAWPRGLQAPRISRAFVSCAALTLLAWVLLSPAATLALGVAVLPFSWPFLAAFPIMLGIVAALGHGGVITAWWRRLPPARAVLWLLGSFAVLTVAAAVITHLSTGEALAVAAVTGLFNARAWYGLALLAARVQPRAH